MPVCALVCAFGTGNSVARSYSTHEVRLPPTLLVTVTPPSFLTRRQRTRQAVLSRFISASKTCRFISGSKTCTHIIKTLLASSSFLHLSRNVPPRVQSHVCSKKR